MQRCLFIPQIVVVVAVITVNFGSQEAQKHLSSPDWAEASEDVWGVHLRAAEWKDFQQILLDNLSFVLNGSRRRLEIRGAETPQSVELLSVYKNTNYQSYHSGCLMNLEIHYY